MQKLERSLEQSPVLKALLEEGADPDSLEEHLGGGESEGTDGEMGPNGAKGAKAKAPREARARLKALRGPAVRDPKLYDYA